MPITKKKSDQVLANLLKGEVDVCAHLIGLPWRLHLSPQPAKGIVADFLPVCPYMDPSVSDVSCGQIVRVLEMKNMGLAHWRRLLHAKTSVDALPWHANANHDSWTQKPAQHANQVARCEQSPGLREETDGEEPDESESTYEMRRRMPRRPTHRVAFLAQRAKSVLKSRHPPRYRETCAMCTDAQRARWNCGA